MPHVKNGHHYIVNEGLETCSVVANLKRSLRSVNIMEGNIMFQQPFMNCTLKSQYFSNVPRVCILLAAG